MKIKFHFPVYPDLTIPRGYLPRMNEAYACWYFYTLAQQLYEQVGDPTDYHLRGETIEQKQFGLLEEFQWMEPKYEQIARTVATIYQFRSPEQFLQERFWDVVKKQAEAMGYPEPKEVYMRPLRLVGIH